MGMGVSLDFVGKEKSVREERRGYGSSDRNHGGSERGYDRGYDRGNDRGSDRGYDRGGHRDGNGRGYSNRGYNDDNRSGENEPRKGYDDRDYRDRRDNRSRRGYDERDYRDKRESGSRRGYAASQSAAALPSSDDLYEEVRRRERANVTAQSSSRPHSRKADYNR